MSDNKETKETKQEEVKQEIKKPAIGLNINDIPDEDEVLSFSETSRTLVAHNNIINELIKNIFSPLGITEDNGLLNVIIKDDDTSIMSWDTANLDTNEDEDIQMNNTIYKAQLIECLLFGRHQDGLLAGIKDFNENKFPVYPAETAMIKNSFEIVTDNNKKEVTKAFNLIKDTLKLTTPEANQLIFVSHRPAEPGPNGANSLKVSLLIIGRSEEEMRNLSNAYKTAAFGKKVHKAIDKSNTTVYGGAKMIGEDIILPGSEVLGMTLGTLGGSVVQGVGVALSEGANEFFKAFNWDGIKNRTSTVELKNRLFKNRSNSTRGGAL